MDFIKWLTLLFAAAKLMNLVTWSWLLVFIPMILWFCLCVLTSMIKEIANESNTKHKED